MNRPALIYEFGDFRVDVWERTLSRIGGEAITVPPKTLELLIFLIENPGRLLEKNAIMDNVWSDSMVEEGNLKIHVHTLRKILEADGDRFIETIPRHGYRFVADVTTVKVDDTVSEATAANEPAVGRETIGRRQLYLVVGLAVIMMIGVGALIYSGYLRPKQTIVAAQKELRPTSIAVLPFRNLTKDERDEFVGVGLADALTKRLSMAGRFIVRPTSTVLAVSAKDANPQKMGLHLRVEAILDGTIQRVGNRLRISIQLISVSDERIIWAGNFDENEGDLFKIQDSFAENIAAAMQSTIEPEKLAALKRTNTANAEAYRAYLTARAILAQAKPDSLQRAMEQYRLAIKFDDRYALAYAGIGEAYMVLGESGYGVIKPDEAYQNALAASRKALEIDPYLAEATAVIGNIEAKYLWDIPASEASYRRAIELDPNFARAHHLLAWTLIREKRFDEADEEFRRAAEIDPTSLETLTESGYPAFFAGDLGRAYERFKAAADADRTYVASLLNLSRVLHHSGRDLEAWNEGMAAEKVIGAKIPVVEMVKGRTLAGQGKTKEAREIMAGLLARKGKGEYISPLFLAILSADLDDKEEVFKWLDESIAERNDYMPYLSFAPEFEKYRSDPRFTAILEQVKPLTKQ